ncbi:MAG: hypothetical protein ACRDHZ_17850, partial [Ktedonobacteraceae bacterium]
MNNGEQITQYLEELAQELLALHVAIPFHLLIAGGAYMLLQDQRPSTEDIDFALVEIPQTKVLQDTIMDITFKRAEVVSRKTTSIPYSAEFKQAVEIVARRQHLPDDWLNDEAAVYYYDDAPHAEGLFWRAFGNLLYVYLPTMEYMLATKIAAYRPKDAKDIQLLIRALDLHTREQAKG